MRSWPSSDEIAGSAEFFLFGTNDLIQTTFGISRDDAEAGFFVHYVSCSPFRVPVARLWAAQAALREAGAQPTGRLEGGSGLSTPPSSSEPTTFGSSREKFGMTRVRLRPPIPLHRAPMAASADRKLVLLAEDNEDNRLIYSTILRHFGYRVQEVASGPEALEAARSCPPDAVVLDISLPGLDGWTVAAHLRDDPATRDIALLAVTAHAFPEDEQRARDLGFDAFLRKPARPQRVFEEVERLIGGASTPAFREESP